MSAHRRARSAGTDGWARTRYRGGRSAARAGRGPRCSATRWPARPNGAPSSQRTLNPSASKRGRSMSADLAHAREIHRAAVDVDDLLRAARSSLPRCAWTRLTSAFSSRRADGAPSAAAQAHAAATSKRRECGSDRIAWRNFTFGSVSPHDTRPDPHSLRHSSPTRRSRRHGGGRDLRVRAEASQVCERAAPAPGSSVEIAPGVRWARIPLPMDLNHINVWLVETDDGCVDRRHRHGRADGQGRVGSDRARDVRDAAGARRVRHAHSSRSQRPRGVAAGTLSRAGAHVVPHARDDARDERRARAGREPDRSRTSSARTA